MPCVCGYRYMCVTCVWLSEVNSLGSVPPSITGFGVKSGVRLAQHTFLPFALSHRPQ